MVPSTTPARWAISATRASKNGASCWCRWRSSRRTSAIPAWGARSRSCWPPAPIARASRSGPGAWWRADGGPLHRHRRADRSGQVVGGGAPGRAHGGAHGHGGMGTEPVPHSLLRGTAGSGLPDRALLPPLALSPAAGAHAADALPELHPLRLRVREEQAVRVPQPRRLRAAHLREALLAARRERAAARPRRLPP